LLVNWSGNRIQAAMTLEYRKKILHELLISNVDGQVKKVDGWHIDAIDHSLKQHKKNWYEKSLEFFEESCVLTQQLHIPWNLYLEIFLKESSLQDEYSLETIHHLKTNMSDITPPEVIMYSGSLIKDCGESIHKKNYNFTPKGWYSYLRETYDSEEQSYTRDLFFEIQNIHLFKLMIKKLSLNNDSIIEINTQIQISEKVLSQQPQDSKILTKLGILYLFNNDIHSAIKYLNDAFNNDPRNPDPLFWLALYNYYFANDIQEAINLLKKALLLDQNRSDFFIYRYLFTCKATQSIECGMPYLTKAIEISPDWVLPRIQLIKFLLYKGEASSIKKEVLKLQSLKQVLRHRTTDIIDNFYAHYITGNASDNDLVIDLLHEIFLQ